MTRPAATGTSGNPAYDALAAAAAELRTRRDAPSRPLLRVDLTTSSVAAGADALLPALRAAVAARGIDCEIVTVGTLGFSDRQPVVEAHLPGRQPVVYGPVPPSQAEGFVAAVLAGEAPNGGADAFDPRAAALGVRPAGSTLGAAPAAGQDGVPPLHDDPFWGRQERRLMAWMGVIDPEDVAEALSVGRYAGLARALGMAPMAVCDLVEASGLGGRGGAGFPAGRKWKFLLGAPGPVKYVLLNADEGDPGAFVNRVLMESDPHLVLEGMAIAAHATGATRGLIYIRDEYPLCVARMRGAIAEAEARGLLGADVLGTGTAIALEVVQGAGSYVCGDETGLIASLEGLRGMPKTKPPFPAERGVFGYPSNVNNTETYANAPLVLAQGPEWYREQGTESDSGTKMFSVSGAIGRVGALEVGFGMRTGELLEEIAGGAPAGHVIKGIQPGGPLGGLVAPETLAQPLERPPYTERGVLLGSGGLILFDERTCVVDLALYFSEFCEDESCGRCTTCHGGSQRMVEILGRIQAGRGDEDDLERLGLLDRTLQNANCLHGQFTPYAVRAALRHFQDEVAEHVRDRRCRARSCPELIRYRLVDPAHPSLAEAAELDPSGRLVRGADGRWELTGWGAEAYGVLPEVAPEAVVVEDRFPTVGTERPADLAVSAGAASEGAVASG